MPLEFNAKTPRRGGAKVAGVADVLTNRRRLAGWTGNGWGVSPPQVTASYRNSPHPGGIVTATPGVVIPIAIDCDLTAYDRQNPAAFGRAV
jgi:hypothetical protein